MEVYTCDSVSYVICRNLAFLMLDLETNNLHRVAFQGHFPVATGYEKSSLTFWIRELCLCLSGACLFSSVIRLGLVPSEAISLITNLFNPS